jgi:hypothetical protein
LTQSSGTHLWRRGGRNELRARGGLRDRIATYQKEFRKLEAADKTRVQDALGQQNAIEDLLAGLSDCEVLPLLPASIREPLSDLFDFAFKLLSDLGVRDAMYQKIYDAMPEKMCPFCGCETFDSPQRSREALDHYLAKSLYPCAGANLLNLVPMGNKCNSRFKRDVDIIRTGNGRRRAFFPYGGHYVAISLLDSLPFEGASKELPQWRISFTPATEETETWNKVFDIEDRYTRDELDPRYITFLREFRNWCRTAPGVPMPPAEADLVDLLDRFARNMELNGNADRAFLKAAVFRMLHQHCVSGHERLLSFIRDVVAPGA